MWWDCAQAYFRPELLNRLDEIVVFRQLSMLDACSIAELQLNETRQRMAARGVGLQVTAPLMRLICQQGYNQVPAPHHHIAAVYFPLPINGPHACPVDCSIMRRPPPCLFVYYACALWSLCETRAS